MDLAALDTAQLVFNLTGGQRLEWRSADKVTHGVARCGSAAIVERKATTTLRVAGPADTLQIVLDPDPSPPEPRVNPPPSQTQHDLTFQALAAQALVALVESDAEGLSRIMRMVTAGIADPGPGLPSRGGVAQAVLCRAKGLIERGLSEGAERLPSVADVADEAGLSLYHFIRAFSASEGLTPHNWIAGRQVDQAIRLTFEERLAIGEVAGRTGFSSPAHFVSVFRRKTGVTPARLRDAAWSA